MWSRLRLARRLTAGCLVAIAAGSCAPSGATAPPRGTSPASLDGTEDALRPPWPYWPVRMRMHPLTRLVTDGDRGTQVIEARVEFYDREDHTTKATGELRIDLHDAGDVTWAGSLADWNVDLRDVTLNRTYFDDVTFTYLSRLEIAPGSLPASPVLRAYFLSADGEEMKAAIRLRRE